MAVLSPDTRNAIAATLAALLGGSRLFVFSATGRVLVVAPVAEIQSPEVGLLQSGPFAPAQVVASGEPARFEFRQASGLVVLSGFSAELKISPVQLVEGGTVYIDAFTLHV